jgi:superfamily I DNA/RNA helicase
MNFNAEQRACLDAVNGKYVTIAGPGSGKTTTLVERYLQMLTRGIPSKDILNLTFTSAAAAEMVKRVGLLDAESVFRTFHSFAIELLKKEREHLPFKLCDTVIPVGMEDYKLLFDLVKRYPAIKNFRVLKEYISKWKRTNVDPAEAKEKAIGEEYIYAIAYEDYEYECREEGWLDFDSLIRETKNLLETNPEVRARWRRKYIAVDECQDTDVVQFAILQLIFDGNIFVVGDENQLIYEWRSAQSGNLTNFSKKFDGAVSMYLGQNYRSTKRLVEFFKKILPVDNGIASHMVTDNEEGTDPVFVKYEDDQEETYWVLAQINDPVKTAVIARTNRQLFDFQKVCTMRNIKYQILGKKDFWEQNEIKKLLNLAKESDSGRPANEVLAELIDKHGLLRLYRNSITRDSNPVENLNDVVKMAAGKGTISEFVAYLRKRTHGRKSAKGLTLSTVHQAKGREWDNVFVIGAEQGRMPHKDGELMEEHRIFYVACTRAAKFLHISFSGNRSMFLNQFKDQIRNNTEEAL